MPRRAIPGFLLPVRFASCDEIATPPELSLCKIDGRGSGDELAKKCAEFGGGLLVVEIELICGVRAEVVSADLVTTVGQQRCQPEAVVAGVLIDEAGGSNAGGTTNGEVSGGDDVDDVGHDEPLR